MSIINLNVINSWLLSNQNILIDIFNKKKANKYENFNIFLNSQRKSTKNNCINSEQ